MKTKEDVLKTLRRLVDELKSNPDEWENPTLEMYLEALAAWLGSPSFRNEIDPSWDLICEMFEAAKIYE